MRILMISDIHANPWALDAIQEDAGPCDYVLCAGDVVTYGPNGSACIAWLRDHEAIVARGNHDNAVAFNAHPRASPSKAHLALAMRDWARRSLTASDISWLSRLPVRLLWSAGSTQFEVLHATPLDPMYDYRLRPEISDVDLASLLGGCRSADVLLVGHTHLPLDRKYGPLKIVNPGSAGQPLDGDPRAAYAVWEDGQILLRRVAYDQAALLRDIQNMPIEPDIAAGLTKTLINGKLF